MPISDYLIGKKLHSLRFMQLFFFSIGTLIFQAIFYQKAVITVVISVLYLNMLWVAISASGVRKSKNLPILFLGLWTTSLIARWCTPARFELTGIIFSESCDFILLAMCIISIMRFVLFSKRVTTDMLFAAVVNYLLLAILFAQIYGIADMLFAGSFTVPAYMPLVDGHQSTVTFEYFSFVTIATLGYGDILPSHPLTQMLAAVEAVIGQFYVAIVVAWLVTLYVKHSQEVQQ